MEAEGCLPPTLVVSGYLDQAARDRLQQVRAVLGTLAKPFDFPVLEQRVAECLAQVASDPGCVAPPAGGGAPQGEYVDPIEDEQGWIEITPGRPSVPASAPPDPLRGTR